MANWPCIANSPLFFLFYKLTAERKGPCHVRVSITPRDHARFRAYKYFHAKPTLNVSRRGSYYFSLFLLICFICCVQFFCSTIATCYTISMYTTSTNNFVCYGKTQAHSHWDVSVQCIQTTNYKEERMQIVADEVQKLCMPSLY